MTIEHPIEPSDTDSSDEVNRCKLNASPDSLTGQVAIMTEEDRIAHDKFSQAIIDDLAPKGAMETQLAQRVACDSWRLNRLTAIEDNIFALGFNQFGGGECLEHVQIDAALTAARVFMRDAKQLQLLSMQEQRLNRGIQKNLTLLQSLQAARKAETETKAEAEAKVPEPAPAEAAKVRRAANSTPEPASSIGFILQNEEIPAATPENHPVDHPFAKPSSPEPHHLPARAA